MRIKVNQTYTGRRSKEQTIFPGVYEVGDERLFGLAEYLVKDQRKAVYLEPETATTGGTDSVTFAVVEAGAEPPYEVVPPPETEPEVEDVVEFKGRKVKRYKGK